MGIGLSLLVQFFLGGGNQIILKFSKKKCVEDFLRNFKIFRNIQNKKCVEDFLRILGGFYEDTGGVTMVLPKILFGKFLYNLELGQLSPLRI